MCTHLTCVSSLVVPCHPLLFDLLWCGPPLSSCCQSYHQHKKESKPESVAVKRAAVSQSVMGEEQGEEGKTVSITVLLPSKVGGGVCMHASIDMIAPGGSCVDC